MKRIIFSIFIFFTLDIIGQPPINFTININSLPTCSTCCDGGLCVTSPSGGCNGSYSYSWSAGNTGPTACSPGMYCNNMTYTICVFDLCDTACKVFTFPPFTGIFENTIDFSAQTFPNPVSTTLFISTEQKFENSRLEIINCLGQVILSLPFQKEVNVSNLTRGYYSLKIITQSKQEYYSKFIKNEN